MSVRYKCAKRIIGALRRKGIKARMDELEEGHYTVDIWYETGKRFEELREEDIRRPLEIFKIFKRMHSTHEKKGGEV